MYNVGDFVVYRLLTVCKIAGIETPSFERENKKEYYKISPLFDNNGGTTIFVPVNSDDNLRPLFQKEAILSALQALPTLKVSVCTLKKPPQLTAYYQNILASFDLLKYLALIKEIATKTKATTKKLSEIDLRFRAKTEKLLCEEFSLVLDTTPEEIKERIAKLL